MKKRTKPTPIKNLLAGAIKAISAQQETLFCEEDIKKVWEGVAGKEAGRHSWPARLTGNTLVVDVDSPTWIYQLNIKRNKIESKLNRLIKRKEPLKIKLRAGEHR